MQESVTWVEYLGRFHPIVVHFPIALLPAAALADLLSHKKNWAQLANAGRFCVVLGAAGALLAAPLGWMTAATAQAPYEPAWLLTAHRWSGVATAVLAGFAAVSGAKRIYRTALYAAAIAVIAAGHFGGMLVYGEHYFAWRGSSP